MTVLLVSINAQFVHTSPAALKLRNMALDLGIKQAYTLDFLLGDPLWKITDAIAALNPKIVGCSIYIWNRSMFITLAKRLRALNINAKLVAGGPEISFETAENTDFDAIIDSDVEENWESLLKREYELTTSLPKNTSFGPYRDIDFPSLKGKLIYLETTLGCPFQCAFCLSGRKDALLRTLVEAPSQQYAGYLENFVSAGVRTIKFLDRTFNANPKRALAWFRFLKEIEGLCFHFEVCVELLDQETMEFLASVPPGKFQFEVGVQSVNKVTLKAIGRRTDTELLLEKLKELLKLGTIHAHVDLIFGLPNEDLPSIINGFNLLFSMYPHELQLGFLKMLPGAPLQESKALYNYCYDPNPPYECFSNSSLAASELLMLHRIEQVFNLFWNSKRFVNTLGYILHKYPIKPFALFEKFAGEFQKQGLFFKALAIEKQYGFILELFAEDPLVCDYLRLDYVLSMRVFTLPTCLKNPLPKQASYNKKLGDNSLLVSFTHKLDTKTYRFEDMPQPKYYIVEYPQQGGYFASAKIVPIET